jgi:alpha-L-fucosidase 2
MNRTFKKLFVAGGICLFSLCSEAQTKPLNMLKLWYTKPAEYFINALPLGNGRLGAMVYGRTADELINLNESSLWSGGPARLNPNPDSYIYLPQVRKALNEDNYALADKLSRKMQGLFSQSYAPVGDLLLHQNFKGEVTDYYRELNIATAVQTTRFKADGVVYTREVFVSYPDQAIILHLTSSVAGKLDVLFRTVSQLHPSLKKEGRTLMMTGRAPSHADPTYMDTSNEPVKWNDPQRGMRVQTDVKVMDTDGTFAWEGDGIHIKGAKNITVAISIATSFNGFDRYPYSDGKDECAIANSYLNKLTGKSYSLLKSRHITDYKSYFDRVSFYIAGNSAAEKLPTDERLNKYQGDKSDHGLESLLYNYGRYLIISTSRKGGVAANLQGLWNVDIRPAWSCNYTVNINLEMNYWAAEKVGLGDMDWPLVEQVKHMAQTGKSTAWNFYHCHGWAAGHNSDIWAMTNPVGNVGMGDPQWANWVMAAPWLCQNIWDKYAYSLDKSFLRNTAYPLMKGAARFCLEWLVDDGHGHLFTEPSTSPENRYIGNDGKAWAVAKGATMDLGLIRNLFEHTIQSTKILNVDAQFADSMQTALAKMLPYQIGAKGNLQEWAEDYKDADPTHRHVSHLFALHPGNDISAWNTPNLFNACKVTLRTRGDGGTGWSRVWKICFWARLLDGDHAYKLLQNDLFNTVERGFTESGGTYPNMLNACPPYQIDGNFGVVEGISEMLLQSHLGEIHLLPALPSAWKSGYISGIKARGGYTVSIRWENSGLKEASLSCIKDDVCHLRTSVPVTVSGIQAQKKIDDTVAGRFYVYTFNVKKGCTYIIRP